MDIRLDDVRGPEIAALLQEHLRDMYRVSPPESVHALDLESLRQPDITVWTLWDAGTLAGCGALKELDPQHGEIKSMRTASSHRRKGVATAALAGALDLIAGMGGGTVEGYPECADSVPAGFLFNGALSTYERLGFTRDRMIGKHRWVVTRVV